MVIMHQLTYNQHQLTKGWPFWKLLIVLLTSLVCIGVHSAVLDIAEPKNLNSEHMWTSQGRLHCVPSRSHATTRRSCAAVPTTATTKIRTENRTELEEDGTGEIWHQECRTVLAAQHPETPSSSRPSPQSAALLWTGEAAPNPIVKVAPAVDVRLVTQGSRGWWSNNKDKKKGRYSC